MEFVTRMSFHEHLSIEHDVHPQIHELTFGNMDEFKVSLILLLDFVLLPL